MQKVLLLTIGMFTLGFDAYVVAGLLPTIGATFNLNASETGQAVSIFTVCYALAAPIFATMLAGKPVRRILVLALAVFSLANGASALAPSLSWFLVARGVAGIGAGLFSPLAAASASSLVSKDKRGRVLAMTLGGMSMGTVAGVPIGLIIADHLGWQGTLWLITTIGVISMIGLIIWFPNFPASAQPTLRQRVAILKDRQVSLTVVITFLTSIASLGLYTYIAPIILNLVGIDSIMPYLWVWGIGGVVGSFSVGTLIDRTGRPCLLMCGILTIMALAIFCLPLGLKFHLLEFLPFVLWGATGWASQAPQQHILIHLQPNQGAIAIALNSSANYLGSAVGSAVGGGAMLVGLSPGRLPFFFAAVVLLALLGQLVVVKRKAGFRKKWGNEKMF